LQKQRDGLSAGPLGAPYLKQWDTIRLNIE
jgi:hypothetical protein